MKVNNNLLTYEDNITYDNVEKAWKIVRSSCKNKKAIFRYSVNRSTNNYSIYRILKEKRYKPLPFKLFMIFEPKPRLVMSQTPTDKIINHFVTNYYLLPYLEKTLIDQNIATRKNKGSEYGNKLVKDYINKIRINNKNEEIFCLKLDISKYFYNINHDILINKLEKKIKDKDVIDLVKIIISETNKNYVNEIISNYNSNFNTDIPYYKYNTGLSIGAMTSQFLAIYYLNDLDHFIKEKLKAKYYIRYMDDFLIFDTSKDRLKEIWKEIEKVVNDLKLKLNPKSGIYKLSSGISFLGYTYKIENGKFVIKFRKKTFEKINKKLKHLKKYDILKYYKSYASYFGYLSKLKMFERNFKMKAVDKYKYFKEKYPKYIVLIKEGSFYKTYEDDAIILWHLMNYKWNNGSIAFGVQTLFKVLDMLKNLGLSYLVTNSNEDVLRCEVDEEVYSVYSVLAKKKYERYKEKVELMELLDSVLTNTKGNYETIKKFLNDLNIFVNEDVKIEEVLPN